MISDLFAKIRRAFGDYAVDKRLLQEAEISKLPGFVAEYLMTEFSMNYPSDWLERLRDFVRRHYFEASEKEYVKHMLVERRKIAIIDEPRIWVDLEAGEHKGIIPTIGEVDVRVPADLARKYQMAMITGMWGLIELEYSPDTAKRGLDGSCSRTLWLLGSSRSKPPHQIRRFSGMVGSTSHLMSGSTYC